MKDFWNSLNRIRKYFLIWSILIPVIFAIVREVVFSASLDARWLYLFAIIILAISIGIIIYTFLLFGKLEKRFLILDIMILLLNTFFAWLVLINLVTG